MAGEQQTKDAKSYDGHMNPMDQNIQENKVNPPVDSERLYIDRHCV